MLRRKMMVMAMAAAMIGTMTGSVNVYAAKAGDSATGKTELADADFDTSYPVSYTHLTLPTIA